MGGLHSANSTGSQGANNGEEGNNLNKQSSPSSQQQQQRLAAPSEQDIFPLVVKKEPEDLTRRSNLLSGRQHAYENGKMDSSSSSGMLT